MGKEQEKDSPMETIPTGFRGKGMGGENLLIFKSKIKVAA